MNSNTHERPTRGRPRDTVQPPAANVVKPQQYDHMRAPVWTQTLSAPVRDGALDHQNIESRGFRC